MAKFFTKYENILYQKPFWFNPTNLDHKKIYGSFISAAKLIRALINNTIIEDEEIEMMYCCFQIHILEILDLTTNMEHLEIAVYYSNLENKLLDECEEEELYESCHNIKRFYDFYYDQIKREQ